MKHETTITDGQRRGDRELHCTCTPTGTLFVGSQDRCEMNADYHRADIQREAAARLAAGMKVRHANPELATWQGEIIRCTRGSKKGAWLDHIGGFTYVYVRWSVPGQRVSPGWYSADAVRPLEA